MNLLAANYSSWGSRILPSSLKRREPSRSVLPNEVVCVAHSFGLSAFRLQCLGCVDFVRSLSAAFNINPHFVPPVDSSHLAPAARERFFLFCFVICTEIHASYLFSLWCLFSKKSACVCVCLSVFWFLRRSFRWYQSSAFPLTWKGTIRLCFPVFFFLCFF